MREVVYYNEYGSRNTLKFLGDNWKFVTCSCEDNKEDGSSTPSLYVSRRVCERPHDCYLGNGQYVRATRYLQFFIKGLCELIGKKIGFLQTVLEQPMAADRLYVYKNWNEPNKKYYYDDVLIFWTQTGSALVHLFDGVIYRKPRGYYSWSTFEPITKNESSVIRNGLPQIREQMLQDIHQLREVQSFLEGFLSDGN